MLGNEMKLILLGTLCLCLSMGCGSNPRGDRAQEKRDDELVESIKTTEFSESQACKALLRDLKFDDGSPIAKALLQEQFVREPYSGDCVIESSEGQFSFNVKKMRFRLVHGIEFKTGAPHVIRGELYISESGELKARW